MNGYFYKDSDEDYSYIRLPRALLSDEKYKKISTDAKFLYSLLLDRMYLSRSSGWYDEDGRIYIIFTVKELMEIMGCGDRKITKLMDELENQCELIERKRQGQGKPNIIYVKSFESSNERIKNRQNNDSKTSKMTILEPSKQRCNKNDNSNTDISKTNLSISSSRKTDRSDREIYEKIIKNNIDYDILSVKYPLKKDELNEIVGFMTDTVCSKKQYIRVGGDDKPTEIVKGQLLKLNSEHTEYCMECLGVNTSDVRNIRSYLLTTLYNAPLTMSNYYGLKVRHDMADGVFVKVGYG